MEKSLRKRPVLERFWAKVEKTSGCWYWSGTKTKAGYGQINIDGVPVYAHRLSWEIYNKKKIPKGKMVLHHCDNPPCIRPTHIYVGTASDNSKDCIRRGRAKHPLRMGEQIGTSKLTKIEVKEIRSLYMTRKMLAERYGVSEGTIGFILRNQTWKHVKKENKR